MDPNFVKFFETEEKPMIWNSEVRRVSEGAGNKDDSDDDEDAILGTPPGTANPWPLTTSEKDQFVNETRKQKRRDRRLERLKASCEGCCYDPPLGHPSQRRHMGPGGCMEFGREREDSDVSSGYESNNDDDDSSPAKRAKILVPETPPKATSEITLDKWALVSADSRYTAPEARTGDVCLVGTVANHPKRSNGERVRTSAVKRIEGSAECAYAYTCSLTKYRLLEPSPAFVEAMKEKGKQIYFPGGIDLVAPTPEVVIPDPHYMTDSDRSTLFRCSLKALVEFMTTQQGVPVDRIQKILNVVNDLFNFEL
jgi:hypothetical protein